jgi:hypothetical protein
MVEPGVYLHYKGGVYSVIGVGEHTETGEQLVVYTAHSKIWIRPLSMFTEEVEVNGMKVLRFQHVTQDNG